jgi:acetyltransferase-like isoleucine patch superfamily enzyme
VQKDHRPYFVKKAYLNFQRFWAYRFLRPHFEKLGKGYTIMKPWNIEVFGSPIEIGDYVNIIASPDNKVRLSVWPETKNRGRIKIGNYCLVCPGVRISSANGITIGDNCMVASNAYITDSDWHDIYNRIDSGKTAPVVIENNVWIGDSAIICKGTTIGENSIIGAGAVVVNHIPPNTISAGNPAKIVKQLDPKEKLTTRAQWYADPDQLEKEIDDLDREKLEGNTVLGWVRYLLFPTKGD